MEQEKQYDSEIDLRAYLNTVIKRKKIIITIFLVAVMGTAIASVLTPNTYQSTALILITPAKINMYFMKEPGASENSIMALETHKVLLTSNAVLKRVIDKLNLRDREGKILTIKELLGKILLKEDPNTYIFQLSAQDREPQVSMNIANAWAQEYIQYSGELISGEINSTVDFISNQLTATQQNLYDAQQKLADFQNQYKMDLMQSELDTKKSKLISSKTSLLNLKTDMVLQEDSLKALNTEIANQSQFILISKAITDNALWQASIQGKELGDWAKKKLTSESLNPIYKDLNSRIVNTEIGLMINRSQEGYLGQQITSMEKDVDNLENIVDQKYIIFDQLSREIETYKKMYDNLFDKVEKSRMTKLAELGEIKLVSPAYQADLIVRRNTLKKMVLAGVMGFIMGIFGVFIQEAWARK